jgi:hypothetical protein
MTTGPITRFINDEQPDYVETFISNGVSPDMSTGWTFSVVITTTTGTPTTLLTKSTGITGAAGGVVTVMFTGVELATALVTATFAVDNVSYLMFLTARRTADTSDLTASRQLLMKWRP